MGYHACRITSDQLLGGFGQLGMQHVAKQLTSLSLALSCATGEAQWRTDANMLAALAQLSELRHLDVGNCLVVPTDGAHLGLQPFPVEVGACHQACFGPLSHNATVPCCRDMGIRV
jgi:hypothetical protein